MDECAGKELSQVQTELSAALALQAKPLGIKSVSAVEAQWVIFEHDECGLEASLNKGGTIYPLVYVDCELYLTVSRLKEVRHSISVENYP